MSTLVPESTDNLDGNRQVLRTTVRAAGQPGSDDPVMRVEQLEQSHFFVPERVWGPESKVRPANERVEKKEWRRVAERCSLAQHM